MPLTPAQNTIVKNDIAANSDLNSQPNNTDGALAIADLYNLQVAPDYWVWRNYLPKAEIVGVTTPPPDNTSWSWTIYIGRSVGERDAWVEMFAADDTLNMGLANVRQGINDIFSAGPGAPQRTHLFAIGRRKATRIEKLLASGTGTTGTPATMGFVGPISYQEVHTARNS